MAGWCVDDVLYAWVELWQIRSANGRGLHDKKGDVPWQNVMDGHQMYKMDHSRRTQETISTGRYLYICIAGEFRVFYISCLDKLLGYLRSIQYVGLVRRSLHMCRCALQNYLRLKFIFVNHPRWVSITAIRIHLWDDFPPLRYPRHISRPQKTNGRRTKSRSSVATPLSAMTFTLSQEDQGQYYRSLRDKSPTRDFAPKLLDYEAARASGAGIYIFDIHTRCNQTKMPSSPAALHSILCFCFCFCFCFCCPN